MKQSILIVLILMIVSSYLLWPKKETIEPAFYQKPAALPYFEIEIQGAVVFPGKYRFFESTTFNEIVIIAGGLHPKADISTLSYPVLIDRNYEIKIPFLSSLIDSEQPKVNINKASFKQLIEVPYISESIAASILIYRESHGVFFHTDELLKVKYIGQATLEKIKPYISLG
jgi:competence protein ComEA